MTHGSSTSRSCVLILGSLLWMAVDASRKSVKPETVSDLSQDTAKGAETIADLPQDIDPSELIQVFEEDAESLSEVDRGEVNSTETTRQEDVECWCIDNYEYVDYDDYGPGGASSGDFPNIESCIMGRSRCNELCERDKKHRVFYEGKSQTISFCGSDNGFLKKEPECQCLDSSETFKHSNVKKAVKKGGSPSALSQFIGAKEYSFEGYGSNSMNLAACYLGCPALCAKKQKLTGGCAMPDDA